jgi:hypothetical protein
VRTFFVLFASEMIHTAFDYPATGANIGTLGARFRAPVGVRFQAALQARSFCKATSMSKKLEKIIEFDAKTS